MSVPYKKPALSFKQQLDLLKSRGLTVGDDAAALRALERFGYYRLSGYWYTLRSAPDKFAVGATFNQALFLYDFDRRLRLRVLDAIELAEIQARTAITYAMGHAFGPFGHCYARNFAASFDHGEWYAEHTTEVRRSRDTFIAHFQAKYDSFPNVPIWMASEVMSLGMLSSMYEAMRGDEKKVLANAWRVTNRVAESWLHSLTYVRNVSAHHSRLWNKKLAIEPALPEREPEWADVSNRKIFAVLCILRRITRGTVEGEEWAKSISALLHELDPHPKWQQSMGLPNNWPSHPLWK